MYSGCLGGQYIGLGVQTLALKKTLKVFFFRLYFNKKYIEVAINDLTMHLIISKWFRSQKCRLKRKTTRPEEVEETVYKSVFTHLNM